MRHRLLAAWGCAAALALLARTASAQGADATGGIPPGYERIESADLTLTVRDDNFTTVTVDPTDPQIAYVGTNDGRIYKTMDRGLTWSEAITVTETRNLWATAGSSIFFGGIRDDGGGDPDHPLDAPNLSRQFHAVPMGTGPMNTYIQPLSGAAVESAVSAGAGETFLGVGLSSRAPRLSILTGSRGRPVPVLNRQRLLVERTLRGTKIVRITVDPNDHDRLFAATVNGLYKSYNGGVSWVRAFSGFRPAERVTLRVAIRPGTPKLAILGTASGAYSSTDDGENWSKITTIGDTGINDVAFDPHDNNIIYIATQGGVLRSNDAGRTYIPVYFSTFPAENDIQAVVVDPFDDNIVYIATMRGAFVTHKARTASYTDWTALEGVQSALSVTRFAACPKHKGHIYALTRFEIPAINYGATNPDSGIWESWDGGHVWRPIFTGQTNGNAENFALDAKDPDEVWIAWWQALHRLTRGGTAKSADAEGSAAHADPAGPPMSELMLAALRYQGLELDDYSAKLDLARAKNYLPRKFQVNAGYNQWSIGGKQDDNQYAPDRYLWAGATHEWHILAWATWALPETIYAPDSVPLLRTRITQVNDELRKRIFEMIQRNYGELERLHATLAAVPLDLRTRVIYRVRIEQLETVIDLATGDYLSRWKKKHRRPE